MIKFIRLFDIKPFHLDNNKKNCKQPIYPKSVSFKHSPLEDELGFTKLAVTYPVYEHNSGKMYSNVILTGIHGTFIATYDNCPSIVKHFEHTIYAEDQSAPLNGYLDQDKRIFHNYSKYHKSTGGCISAFDINVMLVRNWIKWIENFDLVEKYIYQPLIKQKEMTDFYEIFQEGIFLDYKMKNSK